MKAHWKMQMEVFMKKLLVMMSVGLLVLGMTGCRNRADNTESQSSEQQSSEQQSSQPSESSQEIQSSEAVGEQQTGTVVNGYDYTNGWTEEMTAVKTAVTDTLGENYWPNSPVMPDMLETFFGISSDMYDDYLAETPMISTNVDTLIVIKAKEGQAEAVEEALNAYRDTNVNDTLQYPMNVGKIQASRVERIGDYVCFVQLGADTMTAMESGDEAVIAQCQEVNELVIEVIRRQIEK